MYLCLLYTSQVAGSYDLIYRVSDKAGNEATATRTVVVKETVSIEASTDKQNYEVGETITLTVVTGSDVRAIGLRDGYKRQPQDWRPRPTTPSSPQPSLRGVPSKSSTTMCTPG